MPRPGGNPVPTAEVLAREAHALELRQAGASYQKIAEEINCGDKSNAHKIVKRAIARVHFDPASELRDLEAARLDRLQLGVWSKAVRGDLGALDRVLRVMERRAKLLGLDHADGIAERALQIEADKVRLVALAFGKALDAVELTPEQRETMTRVLLEELRAHDGHDDDSLDDDARWEQEPA